MPLPDLIEVVPLSPEALARLKAAPAQIAIPGSKSITNRAIVLAALGDGAVTLQGALWSEDTEAMTECMRTLGINVEVAADPLNAANRRITVHGCGGVVPPGGTEEAPTELFVANAGTAARFLTAMVCLGSGVYRLSGVPRMHERPQAELVRALRALGYRVDTPNERLPALVHGGGPRPGPVLVSVSDSSQFASALLLSSARGGWVVSTPEGSNPDELPYVEMTRRLVETFPHGGGDFQVEPDASSASYFHAANALFPDHLPVRVLACQPPKREGGTGWQIDAEFPRLAPTAAAEGDNGGGDGDGGAAADPAKRAKLAPRVMTAIAIAPLASQPHAFASLGVLRKQECERVAALRDELRKCKASVEEEVATDTLSIAPTAAASLGDATVATYHDHRMAMCFATLALKVRGIKIEGPRCVRKTVPSFFQILAASPPSGLGVEVWECNAATGERLRRLEAPEDLFAA
ncbi:EPSP synthase, partial [Emiliania huxleyi CCMP1516]|uniref:3-phosphoshikimate 1-carboxyvinyltransferase n=2 Tax=Emiliania huxleyi TaxID=2903 RepID=A0A0D3KIC2_EMIH1|eukprot:XP_005787936.1 EPSP synthase [Emiliania huxleyi CCMP1516]